MVVSKESILLRLSRTLNAHSLTILLMATCVLVLMLVIDSHQLQTPQDIHNRLLQDMFGLNSESLRRWLHSGHTTREPEFILR
ncbi:uncharacterized protein LOC124366383 isoform X2 [Homalodisca vitripennis]|uniref:uncharacterized protein LOC124366383 isoform X2 n=1 Tax=Homalodisca vitripennis TaxID=197043 RepID=UPI001EEAA636|nr:uncharacterized protein LOC124366383 isoform X2 [Homalodisca vitripennis]